MASSSTTAVSQYHHFVPRFILRNFAHPFQPSSDPVKGSPKRNRRKRKNGYYPGDAMLNTINLAGTTAEVIETPVSKTLGMTDMYRDLAAGTNQYHLEEKLSKLESHAGRIISTIRKAFEAGDQDVWITRPDRDTLRKFLFIMKYRGSGAHKRFYHQDPESYSSDDKERLLEYMHRKGFQKPIDVWFDNINAMLELKMDPAMEWMEWLMEHAYPDDAKWFIVRSQMMYLALCTPSGQSDEFLLTENLYSIHEGPVSLSRDPDTNEAVPRVYTELHTFSVISPKLMMVLRSFILPVLEEDANEEIKAWREEMYQLNAIQHNDPLNTNSIIKDLPISKARNSYTMIVDGRIVLRDGEDGRRRSHHKFCFRFFPISTEYTNTINSVMLEESCHIATIVFKTRLAACKTLEHYLRMPCEVNGRYSKVVADKPDDPRFMFLQKLEQVVKQLGSNTTAIYHVVPDSNFETLGQKLAQALPKEPTGTMRLYMKLGGSGTTLPKDLDQAHRMLNMRIKIDVWSKGLRESIREDIRTKLRELFCQLPARRFWYYLKLVRNMLLKGKKADRALESLEGLDLKMDGAEDVIVNGNNVPSATHLIRSDGLCRLMYFAAMNEIHIAKNTNRDPAHGGTRFEWQMKFVVLGPVGSICDCAITTIQERARFFEHQAPLRKEYKIPFYTHEENLEIYTRSMTRKSLKDLYSDILATSDMQALERVIFDIVYPCPDGHI